MTLVYFHYEKQHNIHILIPTTGCSTHSFLFTHSLHWRRKSYILQHTEPNICLLLNFILLIFSSKNPQHQF